MPAANLHPPGRRNRQRCSDGDVLRGALSGLSQQDLCQLSISILPASAVASDAGDGVTLPGALSHLGQQAHCQLPVFIIPATIASDAVMVLCCPVLSAISASRPSAIRQHSSFRGKRYRQR